MESLKLKPGRMIVLFTFKTFKVCYSLVDGDANDLDVLVFGLDLVGDITFQFLLP